MWLETSTINILEVTGIDVLTAIYIKKLIKAPIYGAQGTPHAMLCNAHMGKESKKRVDICICIMDSLCCSAETNTVNQL